MYQNVQLRIRRDERSTIFFFFFFAYVINEWPLINVILPVILQCF